MLNINNYILVESFSVWSCLFGTLWVTTYELIAIDKVQNEGWIENDLSIIKCHANLKSFPNSWFGLGFRK
jgi:hypothetical protein